MLSPDHSEHPGSTSSKITGESRDAWDSSFRFVAAKVKDDTEEGTTGGTEKRIVPEDNEAL